MKRTIEYFIIFLLATLPIVVQAQDSFVAKMVTRTPGVKIGYTVTSDGEKYRYDFISSGREGIVIVNPAKNETAILMPEKKYVQYTKTTSRFNRSNDPVQRIITYMNQYNKKQLENEKIADFTCDKSELYEGNQKICTIWFSEELNFPLKIVSHSEENFYMAMSSIRLQEISPSMFEIPEDYTEVDDRMRPVIPEPPAPETWNMIQSELPLSGEYKRGDLIKFSVPESKHYILRLTNLSAEPTKVIRKSFRDGRELPDNEQGPLRYRTERLFDGESFKNTYVWEAGDVKVLEVHEGKIKIEVEAENR